MIPSTEGENSGYRSVMVAPLAANVATPNTKSHVRYPGSIVWTPIHPLSWIAPYVGHCGVCDSEGVVYDFAGPYFVRCDSMAFGWPTKSLPLSCPEDDAGIYKLCRDYERDGAYDFFSWNCHSLVAALLNRRGWERQHPLARAAGGRWTVVGVAALFFLRSRHLGLGGVVSTWGGYGTIWACVAYTSVRDGTLAYVSSWATLQLGMLVFFLVWFGMQAACGGASQFGRIAEAGGEADADEAGAGEATPLSR